MITQKLAFRHLLKNKAASLVTIMGITISVAMMTALLLFSTAFLGIMRLAREEIDGRWHFMLINASDKEADELAARPEIERAERLNILGMADEMSDNGRYFSVLFQVPEDPAFVGIKAISGRMPENEREVLIPSGYRTPDLEAVKIGDKLELPWGRLEYEDEALGFFFRNPERDEEKIVFRQEWKQEYTVCGTYSLGGGQNAAPGLQAFYTGGKGEAAGQNLAFRVRNLKAAQVAEWQDSAYSDRLLGNAALLELVPGVPGFTSQAVLKSFVVVFILIIGVAGIGMIYNAFSISLSRRSRSLSMLSSIGLTRRQKWQMVLFEGLILLIAALPLGILAGYFGISVVCRILEAPMQDLLSTEGVLRPVWDTGVLLRITGLSVLTVILSAIIPAVRSSRFSPIAGLQEEGERTLNAKTVRTHPFWGKTLGFAGEMGVKNMKRARRRTRAMTVALVLSLILFNSVLYLSHMMERTIGLKADQGLPDFEFRSTDRPAADFVSKLRDIPGIRELYASRSATLYLKQTEEMNPDLFDGGQTLSSVVALPPQDLGRYLKQISLESLADDEVILINVLNTFSERKGKYNETKKFVSALPEEIELRSTEDGKSVKLKPVVLTDKNIPDFADWSGQPTLVCTEKITAEMPDEHWYTKANIYAREGENEALSDTLNKILDTYEGEYYLGDKAYENRYTRDAILVMQVLFIGFVTLIALIGFFNILNTILNSFAMRGKEFAVLRSTGMQKRQFRRMVLSEGLIYSGKILFWGFVLSCLLAYGIHLYLTRTAELSFSLPWWIFLASGLVLVLLVQLIMQLGFRRSASRDLVETLRNNSEN